jgi:hypothetical protein
MKKVVVFFIFFIIGVGLLLKFVFNDMENNWICQSGQWVKQGNPKSPKPEGNCEPKIVEKAKGQLEDSSLCYSPNGNSMNFAKAKEIAILGCKNGKLSETHMCNSSTGTWWIDFTPDSSKDGCNPACVVFVDTGDVEINWRCTGLMEPKV